MNLDTVFPFCRLSSGFSLIIVSSMLFVEMSSGTLMIISCGLLIVCTRTSSSSPHFALISWFRASISSSLFVSIFTPPLHDLNF